MCLCLSKKYVCVLYLVIFTGIKIAVVVGGLAAVKQERILDENPEIVVATPGRLWELIQTGNPHLSQLDSLRSVCFFYSSISQS